jgi:hypothetical protein
VEVYFKGASIAVAKNKNRKLKTKKMKIPIPANATEIELLFNGVVVPTDPNTPPTVNAGSDVTITLPINSITLNGSALDSDGTIVGYEWAKLAGGAAVITSPKSARTTVTGLAEGQYTFRLGATDNEGATAFDNAIVTVKAAVVTPPPSNELPVGYVEVYRNDFSTKEDLNPGGHNQQGAGKLNTTNFISAPSSFESIPAEASGGYRSEIQCNNSMTSPDGGVDFCINFGNYKQTGWGGHCVQAHPAGSNSGGSATVSIYFTEGQFRLMRNLGGGNMFSGTKAIESNRWYYVRLMAKWSTGTDGFFVLYIDDMVNPYVTYKGRTQADNALPYWKLGQNNFGNSKGIPILYDNFRIFKKV